MPKKPRGGPKDFAFQWTDEEWAMLEPMSQMERMEWMLKRIFAFDPKKAQLREGDTGE